MRWPMPCASVARPGPVRVVCGKGNNGGDGLVAARHLAETGHEVESLLLWPARELSPDASANLERLPESDAASWSSGARRRALLDRLGRRRRRDLRHRVRRSAAGAGRAAIEAINACGAPVVAADVASGVDASTGEVAGAAVEARA